MEEDSPTVSGRWSPLSQSEDFSALLCEARVEIGADNILLTNMSELSQNTFWKVTDEIFVSIIYNFIFKYNLTTTGRLQNES